MIFAYLSCWKTRKWQQLGTEMARARSRDLGHGNREEVSPLSNAIKDKVSSMTW